MTQWNIPLDSAKMPDAWYNIMADLPVPMPPALHPGTLQPLQHADLGGLFPSGLIEQELSTQRMISIPGEVMDIYKLWRPTPLRRAYRLEKILDTPAKIFYKNEGVSPAGSHKLNTSVPQAYYNKIEGVKAMSTETGAGQWGTALSIACRMFDMKCQVFMVRVSYDQKPYRRILMQTFGGEVLSSPSEATEYGRKVRAETPNTSGSLGIAISEAIEVAAKSGGTIKYGLGSVLNHVLLHQTVIGQEAKLQLESIGEQPDIVIGCCGGGSNFAGLAFPFAPDKFAGKTNPDLVAVEPAACPTLTRGIYAYDFGDSGQMTPLLSQYTLGHNFIPPGIHAGGLRYHGVASQVAHIVRHGFARAVAVLQNPVFEAGLLFAKAEGILPAPESCHAVRTAIDEAIRCRESGETKTILFNLSGHGHFDMTSYETYLSGNLEDIALEEDKIREAEAEIPQVPIA
jgi:tryptophan synthase beta chain